MSASEPRLEMPFATLLGLVVTKQEKSHVATKMLVRPDLCTAGGLIHGGALMAFADSVVGAKAGGTVISNTVPVHIGRRTQVWQTRIETEDGKLVALVNQSQMVL